MIEIFFSAFLMTKVIDAEVVGNREDEEAPRNPYLRSEHIETLIILIHCLVVFFLFNVEIVLYT